MSAAPPQTICLAGHVLEDMSLKTATLAAPAMRAQPLGAASPVMSIQTLLETARLTGRRGCLARLRSSVPVEHVREDMSSWTRTLA